MSFVSPYFPLTKKLSAANVALRGTQASDKLGSIHTDETGNMFKLVQFEVGGTTFASPENKVFKWHDAATFETEPVDGNTDRVCGVSKCTESLASGDYHWLQISGRCSIVSGDDTANDVTVGEYVRPDNDADLGKCGSNSTTFAEGITFARPITGAGGADNVTCTVDLIGILVG